MSAYVVSKRHIDAMVTAALGIRRRERSSTFSWYVETGDQSAVERHELDETNADEIGAMLWNENVKSVRYCYPDDDGDNLPGPIDFTPGDADAYAFERLMCPLTAIETLKVISSYEYQSCEHPAWRNVTNVARAFCERLEGAAIYGLDGYEDAIRDVPGDRPVVTSTRTELRAYAERIARNA